MGSVQERSAPERAANERGDPASDDSGSPHPAADGAAMPAQRSRKSWLGRVHWLIALGVYSVLSVVTTFPLALHLNSVTPGPFADGDNLWFAWELWWFRAAVLTGHDPNRTHNLFALLPSIQSFVDAYFNMVAGVFLQFVASPLATYNLLVLASFALSGLTMYLLAGEFVADRFACFCAGFLYTFSTYHFARAAGHFGLMTLQWLPFCAWRLFAFHRRPTARNASLAGLGIALAALSEAYFLAYFLVPFCALFLIGVLVADRRWFTVGRNLRLSALGIVVAAVITIPTLIDYVRMDPDVRATSTQYASALEPLSADAAEFFVPNAANPLFGPETKGLYARINKPYLVETAAFLGYPALLLAAVALLARRSRGRVTAFWLILGVGGLILACGPSLVVVGQRLFPLPTYKAVFGWPFLSSYRAPARLAVIPLLAAAVLSAFGVAALTGRARGDRDAMIRLRVLLVLLLGFSLGSNILWGFPYPDARVQMPDLYRQIGADHEPSLLLDLPLLPSGAFQFYQTMHEKALVYGYVPRLTPRMVASVHNVPYLAQFAPVGDGTHLNLNTTQGDVVNSGGFKEVMRQNRIKYVVMHQVVDAQSYAQMRAFLLQQLGAPFYDNGAEGLTAWRIPLDAPQAATAYYETLGVGWLPGVQLRDGLPERDMEQDGQIVITAPAAGAAMLSLLATPILKPLTIEVRVNGRAVTTVALGAGGVTQAVNIDRVPLLAGRNTIELHAIEGCVRPSDISTSPDTRCFSIGVQQIQVTATP